MLAPTYCETIDETALLVCPSTHISIDIKVVTIPTAAKASVAFIEMLPTIAASVSDRIGSETPEIRAGIANLFIFFRLIVVLTKLVHNSGKDVHFVLENKYFQAFYIREVRKIFDFYDFAKRYLNAQN